MRHYALNLTTERRGERVTVNINPLIITCKNETRLGSLLATDPAIKRFYNTLLPGIADVQEARWVCREVENPENIFLL